jgi:exosortase family protein XrtF
MLSFLKQFKPAIFFLLKFLIFYSLSNFLYGIFIIYHHPAVDPITKGLVAHFTRLTSLFLDHLYFIPYTEKPYVGLLVNNRQMLLVFEGCNGVNVWLVFLSFLLAYGPLNKRMFYFCMVGTLLIYLLSLLRLAVLLMIVVYLPHYVFIFHKYILTIVLYGCVFGMWYLWIRKFSSTHAVS